MAQGSYHFEDFSIGDRFETPARTITEADIVNYCGLAGDFSPIHTDEEYASDTIHGTRIAQGPLTMSIAIGQTTQVGYTDDTLVGFYGIDGLRFPNPVFPNDTIHTVQEVTDLEEREKGGLVTLETTVYNQDGETVAVWDHMKMVEYGSDA